MQVAGTRRCWRWTVCAKVQRVSSASMARWLMAFGDGIFLLEKKSRIMD